MNFEIVYPRKLVKLAKAGEVTQFREQEVETGDDLEDLLHFVKQAYVNGEEITVRLFEHDPTPEYLYDDSFGEAAVTMGELHENARQEKMQAKS